jgi:peptide/nickel transport system substrate-binding protein
MIAPGQLGWEDSLPYYEYNPEKAKQLLAESGYDGTLIMLSSNVSTAQAEEQLLAISDYANTVGFNTKIEVLENSVLGTKRQESTYDLYLVVAQNKFTDPTTNLYRRIAEDQSNSLFKDETMNGYLAAAMIEPAKEKRGELLALAARRMREVDAPMLGLYCPASVQAVNYGVVGIELLKDGYIFCRFLDYDPTYGGWKLPDYAAYAKGL